MPFVLRQESDTTNPNLATVYGKQITAGKNVYYLKDGRTKCIVILGEGEMDGIDALYYNGELVPEFASASSTDRNWKFHPGTITTKPSTFYDVTAIAGDTLTLNTGVSLPSASIKETVTATGGTKSYSYGGYTTASIPYNATASAIRTALEGLPGINIGDVAVSGTNPYTFVFVDALIPYLNTFIVNVGSLTGGTSTITRPLEVALVAGVDPEVSPYPVGVEQHQKLYVVYASGSSVKLSLTPGGAPLVWTSSQYLLDNLKVYTADGGYFDPVQGRPEFFSGIDFTFSRICYVEINLPVEMSDFEDDEPTKFKIFVRGRRVQNYTSTGLVADQTGTAYPDQNNLPAQTKFFSANNALVALDIMLNYMKLDIDRIDWASFVAFRDYCDENITWDSGKTQILANPSFTLTNSELSSETTVTKTSGSAGWDSGAMTVENTTSLSNIAISGIYRGGHSAIGLTRATTNPSYNNAGNLYSIHPSILDGRLRVYEGTTEVYNEFYPFASGDIFKIEVADTTVDFYKNGTLFFTKNFSFGGGTTRGFVALNTTGAAWSDVKFFPVAGGTRTTNRFDAHVVFPTETDCASALQQIMARAPSCHWQDVNGKIKFIVGTTYKDLTWGQTANPGDRVLADILSFDPNNTSYRVATGNQVNYAIGSQVTASSQYSSGYPASSLANGNRTTSGGGWGGGEGWASATATVSPTSTENLVVDLKYKQYVNKLNLFTLADAVNYSSVTVNDVFTLYGVKNFTVEYWNGNAWIFLQEVLDNNHVWVTLDFPLILTDKFRITVSKTVDGYARFTEIEAWGPETTATVVPRSNIVADSFSAYKTPPENKPNFLRVAIRDLDDQYYTKKFIYIDRDELRDQTDILIDLGIMELGVGTQSLADRIGEAVMRWGADLDLFINLKGMPSTYALSKGDVIRLAHDVTGWTLDTPVEFIVIEETIESGNETADEKTYLLQAFTSDIYSDTRHGAITANFPTPLSPLTPPPAPSSVQLTEETRTLPDGTAYSVILGRVFFDTSYPYSQRARIFWKKALDIEFTTTSIILEQPNTGVTSIPFELNFATVGTNEVKVITETLAGVASNSPSVTTIDISGTAQVEEVSWEQFVNTQLLGASLIKIAGTTGYNAGAKSSKAIAYGDGYLQFTYSSSSTYTLGFNNYNLTDNTDNMKYGFQLVAGNLPSLLVNGSIVAPNSNAQLVQVGQAFKIELVGNTVSFYQTVDAVNVLIGTTSNLNLYPLYVDVSIYTINDLVPQVQLYGRLEQTTGLKVHWQSVRSVSITSDINGIETVVKLSGNGWVTPYSAGTFSAERIVTSGAVEWIASETNTYRILGLSVVDAEVANPDTNGLNGIAYGWYMQDGGALLVTEFGTTKFSTTYTTGDILRIEKIGTVVRYKKNGTLLYTSTTVAPNPLYIDTAFYSQEATIGDIRIKRVGAFVNIPYPYPIYLVQSLSVANSRPQDDGTSYFELIGKFTSTGEDPVLRAKVRVFNKFGTVVADLSPFTYAGNGLIGQGFHDRKYADPIEEAIYEVRLDNGNGLSGAVFVQGGTAIPKVFTETFVMPPLLNILNSVKDLTCFAVDHTRISLSWSFTSPSTNNVDIYYRVDGQNWVIHPSGTNVSIKPFVATGLLPNTSYEFKASPTGTTSNWSNICKTKTLPPPLPADTSPPPLSLTSTRNGVNPDTKVDLAWNRNSTNNTGVKIYQNGTLIYTGSTATETSRTITGLTQNTLYTYKVRNVYAGGDSIDSNESSITTAITESVQKPSGLSAVATSARRINLSWTNNTSSGVISADISYDDGNTWFTWGGTVPATQNTFAIIGLDPSSAYSFRVSNSLVSGYSNVASAITWDDIIIGCVLPSTEVWIIENGILTKVLAGEVMVGDTIVTVLRGGKISSTKVKKIFSATTDALNLIVMSNGRVLECSPSHPVICNMAGDVTKAVNVKRGDTLLMADPTVEKVYEEVVESKEVLEGNFTVLTYELEDGDHTFISNSIVSHNIKEK